MNHPDTAAGGPPPSYDTATPDGTATERVMVSIARALAPRSGRDPVAIAVDAVEITDHGTRTGRLVKETLEVVAAAGDTIETGDPVVRLTFRPTQEPESGWIEVEVAGEPETAFWPRPAAAERTLRLVTHERLRREPDTAHLHGAVIVAPDRRAVLIVGPSGVGKSTISAHLMSRGFDLVTDEQVAVHPDAGVVSAFARPVEIKASGVEFAPEPFLSNHQEVGPLHISPAMAGTGHRFTARPALIVAPVRYGDTVPTRVEALAPAQTLSTLFEHAMNLDAAPREGLRSLAWLAATTPATTLRFSSSAEAADRIITMLDDLPTPPDLAHDVEQLPGGVSADDDLDGTVPFRRAADVLTVSLGTEGAIYHPSTGQLAMLNPDASGVWHALPDVTLTEPVKEFLIGLRSLGYVTSHNGR